MVIEMTIVCLSLSHRFVPAGVLERLAVSSGELGELLARLHAVPGVDEAVVLSTCNRVEVYAAVSAPAGQATGAMADLVAARGRVPADDIMRMARIRVGGAAAEHLFSVACGLDSMAVGEDQIVAQIKAAARTAAVARTTGPAVTGLIDAALRASKRARTQTTISTEGISLARAGLDLAAAHLGGLAATDAVVLGTGSTGKLVARLLRQAGAGRLSVASRSQARAAEVAAAVGGRPLKIADVPAALADANLLVTATGVAAPVVAAGPVRAARIQVGARPLFVLDLGMPPDVEAAAGRLAGVTLADLTTLGQHLAGHGAAGPVPEVRAIVATEAAAYAERQDQAAAGWLPPSQRRLQGWRRSLADSCRGCR
jgi:glutamyl-tRNA reductase